MSDKKENGRTSEHDRQVAVEKGWIPSVRGGYQPATSEAGAPPTGGGGGKEPEKKS